MAYSQEELINIVRELIIDNNTNQVTPAKVRNVFEAVISAMNQENAGSVSAVTPLVYDPFTNTFSIPKSDATKDGFLSKEDFAAFAAGGGQDLDQTLENGNTAINKQLIIKQSEGSTGGSFTMPTGFEVVSETNASLAIGGEGSELQIAYTQGDSTKANVLRFSGRTEEGVAGFEFPDDKTAGDYTLVTRDELENSIPIPDDFFVATQIDSSKIRYETDSFRELDLQPYVPITVVNTNEVLRNQNNLYVTGNFTNDNSLQAFIVSIENCAIKENVLTFDAIKYTTITVPVHGSIFHNGYLFLTSRENQTTVLKMNPYDLSDKRYLTLPNTANFIGQTTDIVAYRNKLYILVTAVNFQTGNIIEISDDLIQYKLLFSIPPVAGYFLVMGNPFAIYNDEIYIPFTVNVNNVSFRVYDLQGTLKRQITNLALNWAGDVVSAPIPHWIGIFNNKILVTFEFHRSIIRLDCATLVMEDSIPLTFSVTDDNSIKKNGYIYLNGEKNTFDPLATIQLVKVKYNNFSDFTILDSNYNNGNGSYGSINSYINPQSLQPNLIYKSAATNNIVIGEPAVPSTLTAPNLTTALIASGGVKSLTTKEYVDLRALIASPAFTGVPTAPTAAVATNTLQLATTAFVLANITSNTVTAAATVTSLSGSVISNYVLTGTTTTLTLPAPAAALAGKSISIKNTGSGTATINSNAGANVIYVGTITLVNTYAIATGINASFYCDGTRWILGQ